MLIDWFTVVAQIVNFLVLVALLKHFLWGRLVAAIDDREKRIAGAAGGSGQRRTRRPSAQTEQARARLPRSTKQRPGSSLRKRQARSRRAAQARWSSRRARRCSALEAKWREDLEREQTAFFDEVAAARRHGDSRDHPRARWRDLACADVQRCAMQAFLEKLQALDAGALRDLAGRELTVVSAGEVSAEECAMPVAETLEERLGAPASIEIRTLAGYGVGHRVARQRPAASDGLPTRTSGFARREPEEALEQPGGLSARWRMKRRSLTAVQSSTTRWKPSSASRARPPTGRELRGIRHRQLRRPGHRARAADCRTSNRKNWSASQATCSA